MLFENEMKNSKLLVKTPQIIVLLGTFQEEEIKILEDTLQMHYPSGEAVSWISLGENVISSPNTYLYNPQPKCKGCLKQREEYGHCIEDEDGTLFIGSTAAGIFNATASISYQEPGIQAAILIKPEQPIAGMLMPMLNLLKKKLLEQFSRLRVDAYLMLDQSANSEQKEEKDSAIYLTLCETEKLLETSDLRFAYVMSNLTNREALLKKAETQEEQFTSIALTIAMKDMIPENTGYNYSDAEFNKGLASSIELNVGEQGTISSLGHVRLSKDEQFYSLVVYRTVWEALRSSNPDLDLEELQKEAGLCREDIKQFFGMSKHLVRLSKNDFDAIVWDHTKEEQSVYTMSCGAAVRQFFGKNLDLYMELNMYGTDLDQKLDDWESSLKMKLQQISDQAGFFNLVLLLEKEEQELHELIAEAEETIEVQNNGLTQWESKIFAQTAENMGQTVPPLYKLAQDYLQYKSVLYAAGQQKKISEILLTRLNELGVYYKDYKILVQNTIDSIDQEIERRKTSVRPENGLGILQITNAEQYYAEITLKLIDREGRRLFHRLVNELNTLLSNGELQEAEAFRMVEEYCGTAIFKDEAFHTDFLHELQNRLIGYEDGAVNIRTETDVSNFLLTQIVKEQHYLFYDRIQQGFQAYEEMTMFLQNDSIFMQQRDNNALVANKIKEQRMRLFCDSSSDSLDVLFLAGNLKIKSLYKWESYENAYKKLMGSEKSAS